MFKFITRRPLWVNILAGMVLVFILLFLFLQSLDFLTKHGKTLTIPSVTGKSLPEAQKILEGQGFDIEIQDSVYVDTAKPLTVMRQLPDAESEVKMNRTVYLTINRAVPPTIEMPNLVSMSFRGAQLSIQQYGLNLQDTQYRADPAKNAVLEQLYEGKPIKPGTKISMGSNIVLVLGSGLGNSEFSVPDLFGMTYSDAKIYLESVGLNLGSVLSDGTVSDTSNAYIYRQDPPRMSGDEQINRIRPGQIVNIWITAVKPALPMDSTGGQDSHNPYQ